MIITLFAFAVSLFTTGLFIHAAADSAVIEPPGIHYNYLSNPRLLAAGEQNVYVINNNDLCIIDRNTFVMTKTPETFPSNVLYIRHENNFLFVFWVNGFRVYNSDLNIVASGTLTQTQNAFAVAYVNSNYHLYHVNGNNYGYVTLAAPATFVQVGSLPYINALSYNEADGLLYLTARTALPAYYSIFVENNPTPLFPSIDFCDLDSFNATRDKFVFTAKFSRGPQLVIMDKPTGEYNPITTHDEQTLIMDRSKEPRYVTTLGTQVFVIDKMKSSVDLYSIPQNPDGTNATELVFTEIIAAHYGDSHGFYNNPTSVCVIDQNRYLVADRNGVKLITAGETTIFIPRGTLDSEVALVTAMVYDYNNFVYIYDAPDRVKKFDLNGNYDSTMTYAEFTQTGFAFNAPVINALGETLDNTWLHSIPGATYAANPSFSLERLYGKLFWLGENHSVQSYQILGYWTPADFPPSTAWQQKTALTHTFANAQVEGLFAKTVKAAVLHEYPSSVGKPIKQLKTGEFLKVLEWNTIIDGHSFDYALVMHETLWSNEIGYIAHNLLANTLDPAEYSVWEGGLGFKPENNDGGKISGRVIVNSAPILKYPTSLINNLTVSEKVTKNYGLIANSHIPGLIINREIKIPDFRGWIFYEIRLDVDGKPNPNGLYVGYINKLHVIDSYDAPSRIRFVSNAHIVVAKNPGFINTYSDDNLETKIDGESLVNKQKIRIDENYDKTSKFTQIVYCDEFGHELVRWIETKYIQRNGISTLQIIGMGTLFFAVFGGSYILTRQIKARKRT